MSDVTKPCRRMDLLYPELAKRVQLCLDECKKKGYEIAVFETWRSPERQAWLYAQGRTRSGPIITNSQAWRSWHSVSCAVDVAQRKDGKWSWDFDTEAVGKTFGDMGLERLKFEACHFQLTGGLSIDKAVEITKKSGLQALWLKLDELLKVSSVSA